MKYIKGELFTLKYLKFYTRQNLVLEDRPLLKLPGIDVVDTGKRIQSWLIESKHRENKFNEVTQRIFDVVSRVTGTDENNIPAINFVGLGRLMIKFNNEVLFIPLQLLSLI